MVFVLLLLLVQVDIKILLQLDAPLLDQPLLQVPNIIQQVVL
jgi:hypothetical protein